MKRVIVSCKNNLINTALTEDGELIELISSEKKKELNIGDIYTGKIKRILKSGFAFVDLGEDKNTFLSLKDKKEKALWEGDRLKIKEGSDIIVQVVRAAENEKGAAVTSALSFSGELAVVSLGCGEVRISRKITDPEKRIEVTELFQEDSFSGIDIIVRTKGCEVSPEVLRAEVLSFAERLLKIKEDGQYRKAPACLYENSCEALTAMKAFGDFTLVTDSTEDYYEYIDPNRIYTPVQ